MVRPQTRGQTSEAVPDDCESRRAVPFRARPDAPPHRQRQSGDPDQYFCENFTIVPTFIVASLTSAPAAVTDAVVSSVPPIHAPATASGMPVNRATHGIRMIIGTATMSTSDVT